MKKIKISCFFILFLLFFINVTYAQNSQSFSIPESNIQRVYIDDLQNENTKTKEELDEIINSINPKSQQDTYTNKYSEDTNSFDVFSFLLDLSLTILLFMGIPITLKFLNVQFKTLNDVKIFVIINSIVIQFVYVVLFIIAKKDNFNFTPAFFYGVINYGLLKDNVLSSKKDGLTKYQRKKFNMLINGLSELYYDIKELYENISNLNSYDSIVDINIKQTVEDVAYLNKSVDKLFYSNFHSNSDKSKENYITNFIDAASVFLFNSENLLRDYVLATASKSDELIQKHIIEDKKLINYYYNRFEESNELLKEILENEVEI